MLSGPAACKQCEKGFYAYEASPTCTSCPAGKKNNDKGGVSHTKPSCHCTSSRLFCFNYCLSTCREHKLITAVLAIVDIILVEQCVKHMEVPVPTVHYLQNNL